ncbi:MAG: APC family permease [Candidatus Heimdallarchaeota archaeon]|nr:APC family permease [Candidatus Heimdallarchaeota archaeon]
MPYEEKNNIFAKIRRILLGPPKDLLDQSLFKKVTLVPLLAWIGLGADGLSSSCYGPQEAFTALGSRAYLAVFLAIGVSLTIVVLSSAYSNIIENFPRGGGGYVVASRTLSKWAGLVSGSTLVIDYILTIAVSLTAAADAIFSFLPSRMGNYKIILAIGLVVFLILLNLRGVKESIVVLTPIFILFLITHIILIILGIAFKGGDIGPLTQDIGFNLREDLGTIGTFGVLAIVFRAYSLGGGTYTGLEAVANGLPIMREPQHRTGKRAMLYMAISLTIISSGLLFCYYLWGLAPETGRTFNTILAENVFGSSIAGNVFAIITIASESVLLVVAAQAGFIAGPRVMGNMASDSWLPHRFTSLSDRLVTARGVLLMGVSAIVVILVTWGSLHVLVIMYAINVFLNFILAELGMMRHINNFVRKKTKKWIWYFLIHLLGFIFSSVIFVIMIIEKFVIGGWITIVTTAAMIGLCILIKRHYTIREKELKVLDEVLEYISYIPCDEVCDTQKIDKTKKTAVILVERFNGFGVFVFFSIINQLFLNQFENFIFISVAVLDSGSYSGTAELQALQSNVNTDLRRYVALAQSLGFNAEHRTEIGIDVVGTAIPICKEIASEYPDSTFFAGQLVFKKENLFHRILHNRTAFSVQWHLQKTGLTTIILPVQLQKENLYHLLEAGSHYPNKAARKKRK